MSSGAAAPPSHHALALRETFSGHGHFGACHADVWLALINAPTGERTEP